MSRRREWWALLGVVVVSLVLDCWHLDRNGLGNLYYTAGVRSMGESWHNFFFNSFDPGGFVTVDKPPVSQWIASLSVRLFGFGSWGLLLPSALAGTGSVAVLWCTVRRHVGWVAATIGGLVLALSPVNVAVNRVNLPDPFLILFLVVAAWAVLRSVDSRWSMAWLVGAGVAVGCAFNTKLLVAAIPMPAFGLILLFAPTTSWGRRIADGFVFAATSIVVSLSWLLVVDHTSPSHRPFIGGSTNNTVWNQAFGYNGLARLGSSSATRFQGRGANPLQGFSVLFGGSPGPLRLFNDALGAQIAWLLPLAILGVLFGWRGGAGERSQQAVVWLFAVWLAGFAVVFSAASGTFHSYYTSALGPAVAALVGVGAAGLLPLVQRHRGWLAPAFAGLGVTLVVQRVIAHRLPHFYDWVVVAPIAGLALGVALVAVSFARSDPTRTRLVAAGLVVTLVGVTVAPAAWSVSLLAHPVLNATMPAPGPRKSLAAITFGAHGSGGDPVLADWLRAHQRGVRWQLVVINAPAAAGFIAEQSLSVMALGGFEGTDPTLTVRGFAELVRRGEVRYVEPFNRFGGPTGFAATEPAARVLEAAMAVCPAVRTTRANEFPLTDSGRIFDCRGRARELERHR